MSTSAANSAVPAAARGWDPRSRWTIRLVLATSITAAVAFGIGWPIAFVGPVFVWEYLKVAAPGGIGLRDGFSLLTSAFLGIAFGLSIGVLFGQMPLLFLMVEAMALFALYYGMTGGANALTITWALIATTLLPMLATISIDLAVLIAWYLLVGATIAAGVTVLAYIFIPEPLPETIDEPPPPPPPMPRHERIDSAFRRVLVMMPLIFFVYTLQQATFIITVLIASLISLEPTRQGSNYMGKAMMKGTVLGGACSAFVFYAVSAVPQYPFLVALVTLIVLFLAIQNYSGTAMGPYWGKGLGTFIIVLFSALAPSGDVDVKFIMRIIQIFAAAFWVIIGLRLLEHVSFTRLVGGVDDE